MRSTALAAMAAVCVIVPASAQEKPGRFPEKPIEIVTYTDPGTGIDLTLRALAPLLSKEVGQPVVTVNRPGGNGVNAMTYVMRRPSDGYTLLGHTTTFSSAMAQKVGGFTGAEVEGLCNVVQEPQAITVRADSPFKDLAQLVAYAKANPKKLRVSGGAGASAYNRLFALTFEDVAKIEMTWVPFDSSPEGRRALLAGDVDLLFTSAGAVDGARMLAVTSSERFDQAADVPTAKELGFDIGNLVGWRGVFIRKGAPEEVKKYLIAAIEKAVQQPQWKDFVAKIGAVSKVTCGAQFANDVTAEVKSTADRYRALGIIK
jgi:tripartite-type tricarboxylate transporter receptor subunit TctC